MEIVLVGLNFRTAPVEVREKVSFTGEQVGWMMKASTPRTFSLISQKLSPSLNRWILIFASGVSYGFMALGKKADRNTMMGNASDSAWNAQVNQPIPPPAGFNQP